MCQPSSYQRWLLAGALVCAVGGLMLLATGPVEHHEKSSGLVPPRRAAKRIAQRAALPSRSDDRDDELPPAAFAAEPRDDGIQLEDQPPRADVTNDGGWFSAEPRPGVAWFGPVLPAAARVPADQAIRPEPAPERPNRRTIVRGQRAKRRRPGRGWRTTQDRDGVQSAGEPVSDTPARDRLAEDAPGRARFPRGTPTDPPAAQPPAPPAAAANGDAAPSDDVTFHSGDVAFPTGGQAAIPIHGDAPHDGGSVSLWVQPGWERGNEDDATLVQLGDRLRLAKDVHVLRLETADGGGEDTDEPAGVAVPITEWNPGEWHHVVATWNGNVASLYVDGELIGRRIGHPVDLPSDTELVVGSDPERNGRVAPGLVGRVDLRSRALGDDEVARNYREAVGGDDGPGRGKGADDHGAGPGDRGKGPDDAARGLDHRAGLDRGRDHEPVRSAGR